MISSWRAPQRQARTIGSVQMARLYVGLDFYPDVFGSPIELRTYPPRSKPFSAIFEHD